MNKDDDEGNLSAEMEREIFNMKDIDKMTEFTDNQVFTNIDLNNKKNPSVKLFTDKKKSNAKIELDAGVKQIEDKISTFEKNIQKDDYDYNQQRKNDSDYEEENINDEIDTFTDKAVIIDRYHIIQKKLKEKNNQIDILRNQVENYKKRGNDVLDTIRNAKDTDMKDKKLIDLVKKNQDLNLKLEKYKLKESNLQKQLNETEKQLSELQKEMNNLEKNKNIPVDQMELNSLKKNLKQTETHLTEERNKLQLTKEENTKLNILIKREVGETFDINRALSDQNYFKPRSEIIEGLKTKIKTLENKIKVLTIDNNNNLNNNNSINNSILSQKSNNTQIVSPISTNVVPYSSYKKEKENLLKEIEKGRVELNKIKEQNSKLKSRKNVLEKELTSQKEQLTDKIKILLEKSDNDEKLIVAMKNELLKKGVNIGNYYEDQTFNLNQEIQKLRMQIKEKDKYINNITAILLPDKVGSDLSEINEQINSGTLSNIMNRISELERENQKLKNASEDAKISESLAKENAKLRMKIAQLESRING